MHCTCSTALPTNICPRMRVLAMQAATPLKLGRFRRVAHNQGTCKYRKLPLPVLRKPLHARDYVVHNKLFALQEFLLFEFENLMW